MAEQQATEATKALKKSKTQDKGQISLKESLTRTQVYASKSANKINSYLSAQYSLLIEKGSSCVLLFSLENSLCRAAIDDALLKMICTDLQLISMVEDDGFKNFLSVIDPRYCPPSWCSIVQDHLPKLYDKKSAELKEELNKVQFCSITTDCWTSWATESYITVTCHYINANWELRSAVLNTCLLQSSHTSENLAESLRAITDYWEITEKVHCCISDSASNIK